MSDIEKTTTESGADLMHLNGQMVNDVLKKKSAKDSFNLMAHLANGASVRRLPHAVDKTELNQDDKFIVAALVAVTNAFCYDIAATEGADKLLGGTDGWELLNAALEAVEEKGDVSH